jgi:hypothetical protein
MGYHNLLSKCDRALVAYLVSAGAGTAADVFRAKRSEDLPNPPFTVCFSESAMETHPYSGIYSVKASIDVHTNAAPDVDADTEQMALDCDDRVAATFDAMHDQYSQAGDRLADLITAAALAAGITDFFVQDVKIAPPGVEQGIVDKTGEWLNTIHLEITCCPRTLP